jgi:hypothetical protein
VRLVRTLPKPKGELAMPGRLIALLSLILFATPAAAHPGHLFERIAGHDHLATVVLFVAVVLVIVMLAVAAVTRSRRP